MDNSIQHICLDQLNKQHNNMIERFYHRRKEFKGVMKQVRPDCIISFLPEPNFICLSLKRILKIPIIISVRNDPKIEYKNPIWNM